MRFQLLDILPNIENPVTGRIVSTAFAGRTVPDAAAVIDASRAAYRAS